MQRGGALSAVRAPSACCSPCRATTRASTASPRCASLPRQKIPGGAACIGVPPVLGWGKHCAREGSKREGCKREGSKREGSGAGGQLTGGQLALPRRLLEQGQVFVAGAADGPTDQAQSANRALCLRRGRCEEGMRWLRWWGVPAADAVRAHASGTTWRMVPSLSTHPRAAT
jgi:hypothetical protein